MSILALPSERVAPQRVATVVARTPKVTRGGIAVLDMHVVLCWRHGDTLFASTCFDDVPEGVEKRVLGVSLDTIPDTNSAAGKFAVAVSGLVPVAVPANKLQNVLPGDVLYVDTSTPSNFMFGRNHAGPDLIRLLPADEVPPAYHKVGIIFNARPGDNLVLVMLGPH